MGDNVSQVLLCRILSCQMFTEKTTSEKMSCCRSMHSLIVMKPLYEAIFTKYHDAIWCF